MNSDNLSDMLLNLATYAEENNINDFEELLENFQEEKKCREEKEMKRKFLELMEKTSDGDYSIYVTPEENDMYNICLVLKPKKTFSTLLTRRVIEAAMHGNCEGYIIENVNRESTSKFLKALYMWDEAWFYINEKGECKDLVDDSLVPLDFYEARGINIGANVNESREVIYPEGLRLPRFNLLKIDDYKYIQTFSEALDLVYENKLIGSKLNLIK